MTEKKLYTTTEIAGIYGLTEAYLRKQRSLKQGPKYKKFGKMIKYSLSDVDDWINKVETVKPRAVC